MAEDRKTLPSYAGQQTESTAALSNLPEALVPTKIPGLTIVAHPDASRVGEEVALEELAVGDEIRLSRVEPLFAPPPEAGTAPPEVGMTPPRGLGTSRLSRQPLVLRAGDEPGSVRLETRGSRTTVEVATVGGLVAVDDERLFSAAEVERGVVLLLRRQVALLLHLVDPLPPEPSVNLGLIGSSEAMERLRREILAAAPLEISTLLRGETGSGKELVARALHDNSPRSGEPFVAVNMGALVPSLASAELFGAVRGAYTGADKNKIGLFRSAQGGTLFLDEIGEASLEVQAMLLRALETREVQAVGGTESHAVNVRVIAATDADLDGALQDGGFRPALLHRLAGYEIRLPPLRERRADIGRLLRHFLLIEAAELSGGVLDVNEELLFPAAEVLAPLVDYDWPGNVRELRNVARRLVIAAREGAQAQARAVAEWLGSAAKTAEPNVVTPEKVQTAATSAKNVARRRGADVAEDELLNALEANAWELQPTANALNVSRQTLYRLIDGCAKIRKATDLEPDEIRTAMEKSGGDHKAAARELRVSPQGLKRRLTALEDV